MALVRRVPNRKVCTRSRSFVSACRKWRSIRVYPLMDPEMSHRATRGGGLRRRARHSSGMVAPPALSVARRVRRRSTSDPVVLGRRRRVGRSRIGSRIRAMASRAASISATDICSKSLRDRTSRSEYVMRMSTSTLSRSESVPLPPSAQASASRLRSGEGAATGTFERDRSSSRTAFGGGRSAQKSLKAS